MRYFLAPKLDVPEGMVLIPPAPQLTQSLAGLPTLNVTGLDAFFIDRYEVSNRKFKAFVDAGGYTRPEYWTEPFTEGTRTLSFEQAMERFRDSTGRPGPASWIGGSFPEGRDDFPVSGVSWYEAAAYAKFAGKNLPTLIHWVRVADPRISVIVGPLSNIGGKQIAKVGQFPNSAPFGASDMFGNVKEWVYNEAGAGLRFIQGGAANELAYQVNALDARPPWDRALYNGFRCVRYPKPPDAAYLKPRIRQVRDFSAEKPASDDAFAALKRFYTCEPGDLKSAVDAVDESNEALAGTSVAIDGMPAYLSFVSPTQINIQTPDDPVTGLVPVVVTAPGGIAVSTVTLAQFAPSFLLLDSKHVAGLILRPNGSGAYAGGAYDIIGPTGNSPGYASVAAKEGGEIELFAVGLGPTSPAIPAGQAFSGAASAANSVSVLIDNTAVTPSFVGLSGPGLFQINLTVPAGLGTGDVKLMATVGGVQTPSGVVISLQ
jgi:uncharacterized protein (TIGR03437 family)